MYNSWATSFFSANFQGWLHERTIKIIRYLQKYVMVLDFLIPWKWPQRCTPVTMYCRTHDGGRCAGIEGGNSGGNGGK